MFSYEARVQYYYIVISYFLQQPVEESEDVESI